MSESEKLFVEIKDEIWLWKYVAFIQGRGGAYFYYTVSGFTENLIVMSGLEV